MKRYNCVVTRTDEYIIEFDENELNEKWMENYKRYFADYDTLYEHAENIAQFRARFGEHNFIEGYGVPLINGKKPSFANENDLEKAINIQIISEDQDCEVEATELGDN